MSSQRVPKRGYKVTRYADPMPCSVGSSAWGVPMLWAKLSHVRSTSTLAQVWPSTTLQDSQKIWRQGKLLLSSEEREKKNKNILKKNIHTHTHTEQAESESDSRTMAQQAETVLKSRAGLLLSHAGKQWEMKQALVLSCASGFQPCTLWTLNTSNNLEHLPGYQGAIQTLFPLQLWKASAVPFCFLFTLHNATRIAVSGNASYWHSQFPRQQLTSHKQWNTCTYSSGSWLTVVKS